MWSKFILRLFYKYVNIYFSDVSCEKMMLMTKEKMTIMMMKMAVYHGWRQWESKTKSKGRTTSPHNCIHRESYLVATE